ncbi:oligosaccharide flippase family protein [candidate division GN15 bacterium]|nr:oligosaccharide flippase family protein [candidate division GN15 bacterium]
MSNSVKSEVKLLARHGSIYGLANILDRLVSFIMIPVYTRFLTPADYGVLELIYMTSSVIAMVIGMRIEAAVSRFYFDYDESDQAGRNKVISSGFLGYGGLAALLVVALLPLSSTFARVILDSPEFSSYFVVALITIAVGLIIPIGNAYFRVRMQSKMFLFFRVSNTILTLGLNIYFVVFAKWGVYGILVATLISHSLLGAVMLLLILSRTGLKVDFRLVWEMVKFGLPLIPSNIAAYAVHSSDRYFIKEYVTMSAAGLYSLGYKIGGLVNQFVTAPFNLVWTPRRFETFSREDSERIYARIFTYFVTLALFVGLMISVLSKEIIKIMATEPFWPAYKVVPIIVLAYIIFSFHYHFNIGILMEKKTKYLAYVNVSNGVLNIGLNFALIPTIGIWGAAIATVLCFIFKVSLTYYYSNRFFPIRVEWFRVAILFATAISLYLVTLLVDTGSIWLDGGIKGLIGLAYVAVLWVTPFFDSEEKKTLRQMLRKRKLEVSMVAEQQSRKDR